MKLIWVAIIFWLAETAYFGFNTHPSCPAEARCDDISRIVFAFGCGMAYQQRRSELRR